MTTSQLAKMQQGRKRAAKRRAQANREAQDAFLAWVKAEAAAYRVLASAHSEGWTVDATALVRREWRAVMSAMPAPPADSAWV